MTQPETIWSSVSCQRHFNRWTGGAGDRTTDLVISGWPILPPQLPLAETWGWHWTCMCWEYWAALTIEPTCPLSPFSPGSPGIPYKCRYGKKCSLRHGIKETYIKGWVLDVQSVLEFILFFTCSPEGPDAPLKPLCPSSPFAPFMPCCPRGPGSPSAPWHIHRQVHTVNTAQTKPKYMLIYSYMTLCELKQHTVNPGWPIGPCLP